MNKVYQTKLGHPDGNCLPACIASILDLKLEDIPELIHIEGKHFLEGYAKQLAEKGIWFAFSIINPPINKPIIKYIMTEHLDGVKSAHTVVVHGNELLHDPHPDEPYKNGKLTENAICYFIVGKNYGL